MNETQQNAPHFLSEHLAERKMIVCCGSGGVGKTTLSAVLALRGAALGRKTLVLTIDPAKRLANALGMEALGNQLTQVDPQRIREAGFTSFKGELHAMMLDCKRTFDEMVMKYAPSPEVAQNILDNRYYQHISNAMSGSHEYMAMEKLYELHHEGNFDLIVLDTPPTHNALDFLEAPNRLSNFLDDSVLKWFVKPYFAAGKISLETVKRGSKIIFKILERVTGLQVLQDLSDFFLAFSSMYAGFKERAQKVREVLTDKDAIFLLVTSPNSLTIEECIFFYEQLNAYQTPFGGVIVNKFHADYGIDQRKDVADLVKEATVELEKTGNHYINADLVFRLAQNLHHFQVLHELDKNAVHELKSRTQLQDALIQCIPHFDTGLFDIKDLKRMVDVLFSPDAANGGQRDATHESDRPRNGTPR